MVSKKESQFILELNLIDKVYHNKNSFQVLTELVYYRYPCTTSKENNI